MVLWIEHHWWGMSLWARAPTVLLGIALGVWFIHTIARLIDNRNRHRQRVAEVAAEMQRELLRRDQERRQLITDRARATRAARKKPVPEPVPPPPPLPPVVASTAWDRILRDDEDEQESPPCPTNVMPEMASPAPMAPLPKPRPKARAPKRTRG